MKKLIIASLLLAIAVYLMFSSFVTDVQINKYSDIQAVHDQKAMDRGWIPEILPDLAYEIVETHDLDTNRVFGEFKCPDSSQKIFIQQLKPYKDSNDTMQWENFLFKIDNKSHKIKFRNI